MSHNSNFPPPLLPSLWWAQVLVWLHSADFYKYDAPALPVHQINLFLQELKHRKSIGEHNWESVLFFGCRHRKHDYIYEEELNSFTDDDTLSHLHLAFSREQDEKVYVQDKIGAAENKQKLWELLNDKKGYFYVCGYVLRDLLIRFICLQLFQ